MRRRFWVDARTDVAESRMRGRARQHGPWGTVPIGSRLADPRPSSDPLAKQPRRPTCIVEHAFVPSRSRSSELTLLTLVMWPSTGPVLHGYRKALVIASRSSVIPAAKTRERFQVTGCSVKQPLLECRHVQLMQRDAKAL